MSVLNNIGFTLLIHITFSFCFYLRSICNIRTYTPEPYLFSLRKMMLSLAVIYDICTYDFYTP